MGTLRLSRYDVKDHLLFEGILYHRGLRLQQTWTET